MMPLLLTEPFVLFDCAVNPTLQPQPAASPTDPSNSSGSTFSAPGGSPDNTEWIYPLPDSSGREFYYSGQTGKLQTDLYYKYRYVVPSTEDALFHRSEVDELVHIGAFRQALMLLKGLRAMGGEGELGRLPTSLQKSTAQAIARLSERSDFNQLDQETDPYLYYSNLQGNTYLASDFDGWKLRLPGFWRDYFLPPKNGNSVHSLLGNGGFSLVIGSFRGAIGNKRVALWQKMWDQRMGLSSAMVSRKEAGALLDRGSAARRCPGMDLLRDQGMESVECKVYQTQVTMNHKISSRFEYIYSYNDLSFYAALAYPPDQQAAAVKVFEYLFKYLQFNRRRG